MRRSVPKGLCSVYLLFYGKLFSQSHGVAEVGRDLWRSPCPIPLFNQGCPESVAQDHVQTAFEQGCIRITFIKLQSSEICE